MVSSRLQENDHKKEEEVKPSSARDVVIPYVRSGDGGQELRRALSTLKNIGDWSGKVWIVGDYESWFEDLDGLSHLYVPADGNKWVGIQMALRKVCNTPEVSEVFYYSNDDIYINDAFFSIPPLFREPIEQQVGEHDDFYHQSLSATNRLLHGRGITEVMNYETHTPIPVVKALLGVSLDEIKKIQDSGYMTLQLRTWYGNTNRIGGFYFEDGKDKEGLAITSS